MARIRTVKPELFRHEDLHEAEISTQLPLRLAFIGLFICCDREGRFRWKPKQLKLDVMPYDEIDFSRVLDALLTRGFVVKYEVSGEIYGYIPSWHKHQSINNKESASNLPPPPAEPNDYKDLSTREERVSNAIVTPLNLTQGEKEGKGKGKEGEEEKDIVAQARPRSQEASDSLEVFNHWKTTMGHDKAQLDDKRKALIKQALKWGYDAKQLCEAISGCAKTPHNMGDNERGQRYDGLSVILKSADQIDRFIRNSHSPPKVDAKQKQSLQSHNRSAVQEFVKNYRPIEGEVNHEAE